jgi:hypothetical protein
MVVSEEPSKYDTVPCINLGGGSILRMTSFGCQSAELDNWVDCRLSRIWCGTLAIQILYGSGVFFARFIPNVFESYVLGSANSCVTSRRKTRDNTEMMHNGYTHLSTPCKAESHASLVFLPSLSFRTSSGEQCVWHHASKLVPSGRSYTLKGLELTHSVDSGNAMTKSLIVRIVS